MACYRNGVGTDVGISGPTPSINGMEMVTEQGLINVMEMATDQRVMNVMEMASDQGVLNKMEVATGQGVINLYGHDMLTQIKQPTIIFG